MLYANNIISHIIYDNKQYTKKNYKITSKSCKLSSTGLSLHGDGCGLKPFISSALWWQTYANPSLIRRTAHS